MEYAYSILPEIRMTSGVFQKLKCEKDFDISEWVFVSYILRCVSCIMGKVWLGNIRGKEMFSLSTALLVKLRVRVLGEKRECLQLIAWSGPTAAMDVKLLFMMECSIPHMIHYLLFMGGKH